MRRVALVVLALIALSAPAADPLGQELQELLERLAKIDQFVREGPTFLKGESIEGVRTLGKVVKETAKEVQNPHGKGMIRYTTLTFADGLEVYLRTFGSPVQTQFILVTVTSPKWPIKHGLNVGVPVSRVLEVLGEPGEGGPDRLVFEGETEKVVFLAKNGKVAAVQFLYYAD